MTEHCIKNIKMGRNSIIPYNYFIFKEIQTTRLQLKDITIVSNQ